MAINDFGEKIGGARKDLWKLRGLQVEDLMEMNEAERLKLITKDNVWPKVDYAALVADGMPRKVAWFVKTVRDGIATKPDVGAWLKTAEEVEQRQQAYVGFVRAVKDAVMGCWTEADMLQVANREWLVDRGYIRLENGRPRITPESGGGLTNKFWDAFVLTPRKYQMLDYEMNKKQFLWTEEQKALDKYDILLCNGVEMEKGYDGVERLRVLFSAGYMYGRGDYAKADAWEAGKYFVVDSRRNVVGNNFGTKDEATAFVLAFDKMKSDLEKTKKKGGKTRFTPPQLEHIQRNVPENYRHGKDVSGEDYLNVFAFKGGEFGNWMSEKDRQASLNLGYEALMDLAKVLQVEPADIALGGQLSIAFGARGHGSALAHYEPMRQVINLTKMRGAGSLAHEWAHALDDIFGKELGMGGFMSENMGYKTKQFLPKSFAKLIDTMQYKVMPVETVLEQRQKDIEKYKEHIRKYVDGLFPTKGLSEEQVQRKDALIQQFIDNAASGKDFLSLDMVMSGNGNEVIDSLSALKKEITGRGIQKDGRIDLAQRQNWLGGKIKALYNPPKVETDFYKHSKEFDNMHAKTDNGYWQSKVEMFARAFACYVTDRLEGKSDYLSGHSELAASPKMEGDKVVYIRALPEGEERKAINQCFDALIDELKEKGLLHHKSDFSNEINRFKPVPIVEAGAKSVWDDADLEQKIDENLKVFAGKDVKLGSHQISFDDLLGNAFERSGGSDSKRDGQLVDGIGK